MNGKFTALPKYFNENPCNIKILNFIRTYDVHSSEYSKEPTHNQNQYGNKVAMEQHNIHLNAMKQNTFYEMANARESTKKMYNRRRKNLIRLHSKWLAPKGICILI